MNEIKQLTVNGQSFALRDSGAVRTDAPQSLTEQEKEQARQNIGVGEAQSVTDAKYFCIDDDGVLALKPEYRGLGESGYPYSESDNGFGKSGSLNDELPETIVIPEVVNEIAVVSFAPAMFCQNLRVKNITIPSYITEIPDRFCDRAKSLVSIEGTQRVELLGRAAFQQTKIQKAVFPNLKVISGTGNFSGCVFLVWADIGNTVTELPDNCFRYCERLTSIRGGAGVTKLGNGTLSYTLRLKQLSFADKLTKIGDTGIYLSRINYDWKDPAYVDGVPVEYGENATYVHHNGADYWSGYWNNQTIEPCRIPLRSVFHQSNPQWEADGLAIGVSKEIAQNCAALCQAFVYSAYEQKDLKSPVEYIAAVKQADSDAVGIFPGHINTDPTQDGIYVWMTTLEYGVERVSLNANDASASQAALKRVYNALKEGKFVIANVVSATKPLGTVTHSVLLHGINSNGEVLVVNPGNYAGAAGYYDEPLTYAMPIQNMTARSSCFHIITK